MIWLAMAAAYVLPYAATLVPILWWCHQQNVKRDHMWSEHYAEQRRLDREAGVVTRGLL